MSQQFWEAAKPIIEATEKHPFLVAMVDGTLDMKCFEYYIIQDAFYLQDFADCLRRLSKNPKASATTGQSERLESMAKGAEEAEMSLHESFFKKWKVNTSHSEPMPNTLLYNSHMIRVVTTRDYAEGLAILLPCFWVYMHVGKCMLKLREDLGDSVKRCPQFDEWIDMYAGEEFEKEVKDYIAIVDSAYAVSSDETRSKMKEHFLMSCKLEYMFWDQALSQMQWPAIC